MITYNDLYEALRKEKYSEPLQSLPQDFLSSISQYLTDKKEISSKEDSMFSDAIIKSKKQFENALFLFKELMLKRKKKLLTLAFVATETGISKRDFENMLSLEKELFDKVITSIEKADKEISSIIDGRTEEGMKNKLVIFKENIDELVGLDGKKLGPYKQGNVVNIPKEIAKILFEAGKVEIMDKE